MVTEPTGQAVPEHSHGHPHEQASERPDERVHERPGEAVRDRSWPPVIERDLNAVSEWLWALVEQAPDPDRIPLLGTREWTAAAPLAQLASLARWALLQLDDLSPEVIAARLAAEIATARRAWQAAMKQASNAVSAGHDWHAQATRPTRAEVLRHRQGHRHEHRQGGEPA